MRGSTTAGAARLALAAPLLLAALGTAGAAGAETGWVKDELRLNLRSGPGTQYRIIGVIQTGDAVEILARGDGWTKVHAGDTEEGWIPEGYLQPEQPARVALAGAQAEAAELREKLDQITQEAQDLRGSNERIAGRDAEQQSQIEQLTRENFELRAGARWPEWITGAGLLTVGMIMGAILHRINSSRSRGPRIRL